MAAKGAAKASAKLEQKLDSMQKELQETKELLRVITADDGTGSDYDSDEEWSEASVSGAVLEDRDGEHGELEHLHNQMRDLQREVKELRKKCDKAETSATCNAAKTNTTGGKKTAESSKEDKAKVADDRAKFIGKLLPLAPCVAGGCDHPEGSVKRYGNQSGSGIKCQKCGVKVFESAPSNSEAKYTVIFAKSKCEGR